MGEIDHVCGLERCDALRHRYRYGDCPEIPHRHRTMRFEAWSVRLLKLMESYGCVIDRSAGLSGIAIAEQGRGKSSNLDMFASVDRN